MGLQLVLIYSPINNENQAGSAITIFMSFPTVHDHRILCIKRDSNIKNAHDWYSETSL